MGALVVPISTLGTWATSWAGCSNMMKHAWLSREQKWYPSHSKIQSTTCVIVARKPTNLNLQYLLLANGPSILQTDSKLPTFHPTTKLFWTGPQLMFHSPKHCSYLDTEPKMYQTLAATQRKFVFFPTLLAGSHAFTCTKLGGPNRAVVQLYKVKNAKQQEKKQLGLLGDGLQAK